MAIQNVGQRAVVGVDELDAVAPQRQRLARAGERVRIAVEPDQPRRTRFEERAGVAPEPDGAVDEEPALLGAQEVEHFGGHDRHVRRHQMPNSDSARASSSVYASRCSFVRKRS
jgi:hypothetical protein